ESHTVNHENLAAMNEKEIDFELRESKSSLEKIFLPVPPALKCSYGPVAGVLCLQHGNSLMGGCC
ncbi:MAG: polysaccharide deacetylase family protein, partial [Acidaminococcaceae bacterium]|nr:polysaccharide deacetylase family protein [Acidaminococcaceae bacterium]